MDAFELLGLARVSLLRFLLSIACESDVIVLILDQIESPLGLRQIVLFLLYSLSNQTVKRYLIERNGDPLLGHELVVHQLHSLRPVFQLGLKLLQLSLDGLLGGELRLLAGGGDQREDTDGGSALSEIFASMDSAVCLLRRIIISHIFYSFIYYAYDIAGIDTESIDAHRI